MSRRITAGQQRHRKRSGHTGLCTICRHEDRSRIEMLCAIGVSHRAIASRFKVSADATWRHFKNHTSPALRAAHASKALRPGVTLEALVDAEGAAVLEHLQNIRGKLYVLFDGAIEAGDAYAGALMANRLHDNLAMVAKLTGELAKHVAPSVTNIFINPLFADLQATLIRTLAGFPAARVAVIQALREIEARGAPLAAPAIEHNPSPMVDGDADRAA